MCKIGMGRWSLQSRHLCKAKPWFQCVDCSESLMARRWVFFMAKFPLETRSVLWCCAIWVPVCCACSFVFKTSKVGWLQPFEFPSVVAYFSQANEQLQASRQSCLWPKFQLSSLQVEESMRCSMKVLMLRKLQQFWSCFSFRGILRKTNKKSTSNMQICRHSGWLHAHLGRFGQWLRSLYGFKEFSKARIQSRVVIQCRVVAWVPRFQSFVTMFGFLVDSQLVPQRRVPF